MFGYLYSDELWVAPSQPRVTFFTEDDQVSKLPAIPIWAWDENVEGQNWRGIQIPEFTPENEQPTKLPPPNATQIFAGPIATSAEDLGSYPTGIYLVTNYDYEDFWNPVKLSQINFFDDFEPDYSNVIYRIAAVSLSVEEEGPQIFPVPIQLGFLNAQFDDWDWSFRHDTFFTQVTSEQDTGEPPVISFVVFHYEDEDYSRNFDVIYVMQRLEYEDFSLIADFPPPAAPVTDYTDEVSWQHYLDYRLSTETAEADIPPQQIIPTLAWDDLEGAKFWDIGYGLAIPGFMEAEDDDGTFGWLLNPFVPPPFVCPGPPLGPDADTIFNYFGGNANPTAVLFCRTCMSGKPLLVRGDYAIWCQDCCRFVSKQETFMMTVRAPGQFKAIF